MYLDTESTIAHPRKDVGSCSCPWSFVGETDGRIFVQQLIVVFFFFFRSRPSSVRVVRGPNGDVGLVPNLLPTGRRRLNVIII